MKLLRVATSLAIVTTVGALALACSSDPASAESACAQYAAAIAGYESKCGESKSDAAWRRYVARVQHLCDSRLALRGAAIKPEHITACTNVVRSAPCVTDHSDLPKCELPNGTLDDGAPCSSGEQCKSGSCGGGGSICGTCQPRVPVGGDCSAPLPVCVKGALCDPTTKTCKAIVHNGEGSTCVPGNGELCDSGLYCDLGTSSCEERRPLGAACGGTAPCQIGLICAETTRTCIGPRTKVVEGRACGLSAGWVECDTNLMCEPSSETCVRIQWVAPGGDCSAPAALCDHGFCNQTTKKCPALIADGQPCNPDLSTGMCERFAGCIDGKCQLRETAVCN